MTSLRESSQRMLTEAQERALASAASTVVLVEGLSDWSDMESLGFFVCVRDLEDELIRALGVAAVEAVIDRAGDLPSLRRLQQTPFHRDRSLEQQLHRFMGARSGRKYLYARALVQSLALDTTPRPLGALLDHVCAAA